MSALGQKQTHAVQHAAIRSPRRRGRAVPQGFLCRVFGRFLGSSFAIPSLSSPAKQNTARITVRCFCESPIDSAQLKNALGSLLWRFFYDLYPVFLVYEVASSFEASDGPLPQP